jgi:hypothetical protein
MLFTVSTNGLVFSFVIIIVLSHSNYLRFLSSMSSLLVRCLLLLLQLTSSVQLYNNSTPCAISID